MSHVAALDTTPRERPVGAFAAFLLVATALGGIDLLGVLSHCGGLAAASDLANHAGMVVLAMVPLFVCVRHRILTSAPQLSPMRAAMSAVATTVGWTACLLLCLPLWLPFLCLSMGLVDFWASSEHCFGMLVVLGLALGMWWQSLRVARRVRPTSEPSSPTEATAPGPDQTSSPGSHSKPWRAFALALSWGWLLVVLGLWGSQSRLEHVGTDPGTSTDYFARQLQRDTPKERLWLDERMPLPGGLLVWRRIVTVEPSLPVDLAGLSFENGRVLARRRGGPPVRIELR